MDMNWSGSVVIAAPVAAVYAYLADFPRHSEWAQTVERLELIRPGDTSGVGSRYLTTERQAMPADRRQYAPLRRGTVVKTLCEIRELTPQRRIAWHAHTIPRALGLSADLAFELSPEPDGGTRLTQHYVFHQPTLMRWMFRLLYGPDVDRKGHAQWDASLRNITAILEAAPMPDSRASSAVAVGQR